MKISSFTNIEAKIYENDCLYFGAFFYNENKLFPGFLLRVCFICILIFSVVKQKKKKVENTYICNFVHSRNLPPHFMHSWGLHAGCLFKVYLNVFLGTILLCMKYLVLVEIVQILRQNMPNMPIPSWIFLSGFLLHVVLLLKLLHGVKI